jgi:hypothetical protein
MIAISLIASRLSQASGRRPNGYGKMKGARLLPQRHRGKAGESA